MLISIHIQKESQNLNYCIRDFPATEAPEYDDTIYTFPKSICS